MVAINTSIAAALRLGQTIFVGYVDIILIIVCALLCAVLIGVLLSQRSGNKLAQRLAQLGEVTGQLSHSQAELSGKSQRHMGQADENLRQIRISTDKVTRRGERINEVEMGKILTRVELQIHLNPVWLTMVSASNFITMRVT